MSVMRPAELGGSNMSTVSLFWWVGLVKQTTYVMVSSSSPWKHVPSGKLTTCWNLPSNHTLCASGDGQRTLVKISLGYCDKLISSCMLPAGDGANGGKGFPGIVRGLLCRLLCGWQTPAMTASKPAVSRAIFPRFGLPSLPPPICV